MGHKSTNLKMGPSSKKSQNFWKILRFFMLVSEWMETDENKMLNWKYCITFMFSLENKIKSIKPNFDTITECEWLFLPFAIYIHFLVLFCLSWCSSVSSDFISKPNTSHTNTKWWLSSHSFLSINWQIVSENANMNLFF